MSKPIFEVGERCMIRSVSSPEFNTDDAAILNLDHYDGMERGTCDEGSVIPIKGFWYNVEIISGVISVHEACLRKRPKPSSYSLVELVEELNESNLSVEA